MLTDGVDPDSAWNPSKSPVAIEQNMMATEVASLPDEFEMLRSLESERRLERPRRPVTSSNSAIPGAYSAYSVSLFRCD
jgi:hypothetical protein